jgi:sugar lactone lactonase YvrE
MYHHLVEEGIDVDADGNIYAGFRTGVRKFNSDGEHVATWDINPEPGGTSGRVYDVHIGNDGYLYVAEWDGSTNTTGRVTRMSTSGTVVTSITGADSFGGPKDSAQDSNGRLFVQGWAECKVGIYDSNLSKLAVIEPTLSCGGQGIAIGTDGSIFVLDQDKVRKFAPWVSSSWAGSMTS